MPVTIALTTGRGLLAGDRIIRAVRENARATELVVDLDRLTFVEPSGMLAIATACIDAQLYERPVTVRSPASADVVSYLLRMRFRDVLANYGVRFEGDLSRRSVPGRAQTGRLVELSEVEASDVDEVAGRLITVGAAMGLPRGLLQLAYLGLTETMGNAIEHSERNEVFCVAQRYRESGGGSRLEMAIGDLGVGLRTTLAQRYPIRTDAQAVDLAVRENTSRYASPGRGGGLHRTLLAVTQRGRGRFQLRSGGAVMSTPAAAVACGVVRDGVQLGLVLRV